MMSRRVSVSEQGQLQGAIGSVRSIAMVVGPGIFSVTLVTFIRSERSVKIPGAPWYLAAFLLVVAAGLALALTPKSDHLVGEKETIGPAAARVSGWCVGVSQDPAP